jgi:DNA adenine methylase
MPPLNASNGKSRVTVFPWYGGKYIHLNFILPKLPRTKRYCEHYGGSMAVLLNKVPSELETYNDLNGDLVNFFRVLRSQGRDLQSLLELTPYSREEYAKAVDPPAGLGEVERARRFYIRARQSVGGLKEKPTVGNWKRSVTDSHSGVPGEVSSWLSGVSVLPEIVERILQVQIDNRPALETIEQYDSRETLHYLDPPYPHESRSGGYSVYSHEMTNEDHERMARKCREVEGWVAISGYECPLYTKLFPPDQWIKSLDEIKRAPSARHGETPERQEVLWTNYDPISFARNIPKNRKTFSLFD